MILSLVPAGAQTLYGVEGGTATLWELTSAPGGVCGAPNPVFTPCGYSAPPPCPGPVVPAFAPPPSLLGDVAVDSVGDTVFLTDGIFIEQYVGDAACGVPPPCTPIQSFPMPTAYGLGPLTGMGMDELGTYTGGVPTLWVTDGLFIAGIGVPVACGVPPLLCGPFFVATPVGAPLTDITWDPNPNITGTVGTLWVCDAAGLVHGIPVPVPCPGPGVAVSPFISFVPPSCGLGVPLTGIAYDLATPGVRSQRGHLYVTDGFTVEYVDVFGGPAAPQFYTPMPCNPTPAPLNGLAYASHGITYGFPRFSAGIGSFGQSTTPSGTFGLEWTGQPAGTTLVVLLVNFQSPVGLGYACPPIPGAGTLFWVDPGRPTTLLLFLPPGGPGCNPLPAPLPAGVPLGLKIYCQFFFRSTSATLDATEGLAFTITAP
ncbi:MAG: hypothetical protein ACYTG2_09380 [Planctomycetota bacterium]